MNWELDSKLQMMNGADASKLHVPMYLLLGAGCQKMQAKNPALTEPLPGQRVVQAAGGGVLPLLTVLEGSCLHQHTVHVPRISPVLCP